MTSQSIEYYLIIKLGMSEYKKKIFDLFRVFYNIKILYIYLF